MRRYFIFVLLYLSSISVLMAQQPINVPFLCSFEDDAEIQQMWTLNPNSANAGDQWVVGGATYSDGVRSLYISSNSGITTRYGFQPNVIIAYQTIRFPKVGAYNISFDWKCIGDDSKSKLYVCIIPEQRLTTGMYSDNTGTHGLLDCVSETSGLFTNRNVLSRMSKLTDGTNTYESLSGSKKWQNYAIKGDGANPETSISINSSSLNTNFALAFIWANNNTEEDSCRLGACIDNIQIASATIKKPTNMTAEMHCEDSTLVVSWKSNSSVHDLEFKSSNATIWSKITNIPASEDTIQTYAIPMREEGNFSIRIRGYRGTELSAYTSLNNVVYWCPDNHCINYIDLTGPDTECRYGGMDVWPNPQTIGVIDFGEDAMESRHTVNWTEDRVDPLTTNSRDAYGKSVPGLQTIPDGYLASVRLGNWNNGSESESVTYNFVVDSVSQAILILKYAIVFEDPSHPGNQCSFNIVVLDSLDRKIDATCGEANFEFDDASQWNKTSKEGYNDIYWKDWTAIGLDLRRYHGRTLKVRVTTTDCGQGGHFGYAYYVLDCVSASLQTDNCGSNSQIEVSAPDGFDYRWTDSKGNVVGTDRVLKADAGYETYTCMACMKDAPDCCYQLSTDFAPRYPAPQFEWKQVPQNCRNFIQFINRSHVLVKYDDYEKHTQEVCDQVIWDFTTKTGSSSTPVDNPLIETNADGDTILVSLRAVLGGGLCDSVLLDTIVIPSIKTKDSTIVATMCEGEPYIFAQKAYTETGIYQDSKINMAGCDSVTFLNLTVHQKSPMQYISDTICSSNIPYVLNGISYIYSDTYQQNLNNQYGCDSIINLSLHIVDKFVVEVDSLPTLCADAGNLIIDYNMLKNRFDSLAVRFTSTTPQDAFYNQMIYDTLQTKIIYPFPDTTTPNHYHVQLEFYQHHSCGNQIFDLNFDVQYRASIIEQKWNDVLAILNSKYNGGYTYMAYQWYKDGQPISGETKPYLYQPLDITSEYSVALTRSDGTTIRSCAFTPTLHSDITPFPTLAEATQRLPVRRGATDSPVLQVRVYTMWGQLYSVTDIVDGEGWIVAPASAGNYLVEMIYQDGELRTQHLVVIQ